MLRATGLVRLGTFASCLTLLAINNSLADRRDDDDRRSRSNQSSPVITRGGDSSSRTVLPTQPSNTNGSAARSFNLRSDQSNQVQSSDRSVRSFNDGSRSTLYNNRGFDTGSFSGRSSSSDGSSSSSRSSNNPAFGRAIDGDSTKATDNGNTNVRDRSVLQGNQSSTVGGRDWQRSTANKNDSNNITSNNSNASSSLQAGSNDPRTIGRGDKGQIGSQDSSRRLTDDRVKDFLQLRRDGDTTSTFRTSLPGNSNVLSNAGNDQKLGRSTALKNSQSDFRQQAKDSAKGDESWAKRFGDANIKQQNGKPFDRTGVAGKNNNGQLGSSVLQSDKKPDPAFISRAYSDWRKNGDDNGHKSGSDNRDWSGRWKGGERLVAADQIRSSWKHHENVKGVPFSQEWWHDHNDHHGHWHWDHVGDHHRPYYWWNRCSAPRLTTWVAFDWGTPCYWDYGPGEYIYCQNGVVFVNGVWFEPAPVFYRRTLLIADRVPNWTVQQAAQVEWLPLGVFVISRDGVADNNVLVQLAVTRDGVVGGTIFNQLTGASFAIQGSVDKETQRAVWTYTDETGGRIIMESSIFNLTQPAATGLIHYSPENMQVIELVRLEEPAAAQ